MRKIKIIWICFFIVLIGGGILFMVGKKDFERDPFMKNENISDTNINNPCLDGECNNYSECGEKIIFDYPPVNLEKTRWVVPFGLMTGNHVTPIDHQYFQNFDNENADIEVYSPGKGTVRAIQKMVGEYFERDKIVRLKDYRIEIQHACGVSSTYIHVDKLSEKIRKVAPKKEGYAQTDVSVGAGEIIGWYSKNLDYNLVDQKVFLSGFVVPEHYSGEPWKIHVPDTLNYFNESIKKKMIEKNLRTAEPINGKFDYDIDGKLIGNWFKERSEGYGGGGVRRDYWKTHLSISPDYLDPKHIIVSMGNYDGKEEQFGVLGNSPNPAEIGVSNGVVKYELVPYDYYTMNGNRWDRKTFAKIKEARNSDFVDGIILLQLIENRKLKVEIFPGKKAGEVEGFGDNALFYER